MADPIWLADVLRAAGLRCEIYPGAFNNGHGDFGNIWGVVAHHTGSNNAGAGGIANHPELGLASQLHLSRSGVYTLCGVGIAWHAGSGSWPGLPTNGANQYTIGIEAANDGTSGWPAAQYDAYVRGVAAILRRLGHNESRVIGHKEWGKVQGKWDPGGIDMNRFRTDVKRHLSGAAAPAPKPVNLIDQYAADKKNAWIGKRVNPAKLSVEKVCPDGKGRWVEYENAHLYYHPSEGVHAIPHADPAIPGSGLFETWGKDYRWEGGPLGYPVRDFTKLPDGAVQSFQGGVLYRKDGASQGFYVTGKIGDRWASEGYEKGPLGYPVSNEYPYDKVGRRQDFEHGSLLHHPSGAIKVER
ncbi:endolysin [Gordonia phage Phendrix]|uniref:N-acetylmuramoyl-L-alanine amidase n=1 Tax=Gordonia phage Phendrix TaxID=2593335 RepID=A0A514U119_9CAUD|nr:endolysin [Gordonia phage Phendrix]QDK02641.1 lysin A [Gordonia phage Phendrix]